MTTSLSADENLEKVAAAYSHDSYLLELTPHTCNFAEIGAVDENFVLT